MSTTLTRIGLFLLPIIVSLGFVLAQDIVYYGCSTNQDGPYHIQNGCGGEADLMIYMNGNGPIMPGSLTHTYSVEYVNYGPSTASDIVITLEGLLYSTGFQIASGFNGPIYSGIVEGSFIQRTDTLAMNESGNFDFLIVHPHDGMYVYTASIASIDTTDTQTGNNSFTVNTTVDIVTQTPTLISPNNGSIYANDTGMTISFILPEMLTSNSLQLSFVPGGDLSGSTITMQLMDANPSITNTFTIIPNNIFSATEVLSANTGSIPNGTYDIILSYQDVFGNPAANTTINNVSIINNPGPYVLTEVSPIPSYTTNLSVLYGYSAIGTGNAELIVGNCGSGVNVLAESILGNGSTRYIQLSNLQAGQTYQCTININSIGGMSNTLTMGPFTVRSSGGGGGGFVSADYCPYGDTSGSYYDGNCGPEKNLIEKIVATLISRWAGRSPERIQATLATLSFLNDKVQTTQSVSEDMKSLFAGIVTMLTTHFQQ